MASQLLALAAVASVAHSAPQCWQPKPPQNITSPSASNLPPHPRLRVNDSHLAALNRTIQTDSTAKAYFEGLLAYGETVLTRPMVDCTAAHMSNTQSRTTLNIQYVCVCVCVCGGLVTGSGNDSDIACLAYDT